ncbi:hypothetical protein R3W88_017120 [Solanum pinnatisectum]|uniref:TYRAAT2-like C-terminal domain-containing protein n=1 Tax=Solanum pinnatisectum TaxID=50273 RepID=A0AAV9L3G8_9SOLN|nr:hypothetical protein R3W88_017120 [Solanum pinnatisectum]
MGMGRVLTSPTPLINTKGYENLVEITASDSFDLYSALFMYDKNAMEELERLDFAFEALKELFGHLHDLTAPSSDAIKSLRTTEGILNLGISAFLLVTSCFGTQRMYY